MNHPLNKTAFLYWRLTTNDEVQRRHVAWDFLPIQSVAAINMVAPPLEATLSKTNVESVIKGYNYSRRSHLLSFLSKF